MQATLEVTELNHWSKVLNEVSRQTRVRLKRLYMITSEVVK